MAGFEPFPYDWISRAAGNKKWISAAAVADYGNAQALAVAPGRATLKSAEVVDCRLVNRAGSAAMVGLGVRYATSAWVGGAITSANAYTDDTSDLQNATTGDAVLYQRAGGNGNGLLLGALDRFNTLGLILSTAGDQTSPVTAIAYWNGTTWVDWTGAIFWQEPLLTGLGEKLLAWLEPSDWVKGGSGANIPQTMYNLKLIFSVSGAGTIDPLVSQLFLGQSHCQVEPLGNLAQSSILQGPGARFSPYGEALFPLFSVPSPANMVEVKLRWL